MTITHYNYILFHGLKDNHSNKYSETKIIVSYESNNRYQFRVVDQFCWPIIDSLRRLTSPGCINWFRRILQGLVNNELLSHSGRVALLVKPDWLKRLYLKGLP